MKGAAAFRTPAIQGSMCLPDASKEPLAEAAASCTPARKAPLAPPAGKLLWRLHGAAYDFEPFVRSHPGGELAIRLAQGVDDRTATNLFASYHPVGRGRAWETLERFRVGAALPRPPEPSAFRAEIEAMLTEHFGSREPRARGKLSAQNAWLLAGVAAAQLVGWALWARGAYAGLLLVPLFHWLLAVNVSHDATHFAVSRSPSLNAALAYASLPFFYGPVTWYSQHVVMHHTAANEVDADPDLQHFQPMKLHPQDVRFDFPSGEAHSWADYAKYMAVGLHLCLAVPVAAGGACTAAFDAWYHDLFRPTIQLPPGLARLRLYRCLNLLAPLLFLSALAYPYLAFGGGGGACAAGGRGGSGDPACFGFWSKSLFAFAPPILSSLIFAVVTQVSHVQPEAQEAAINQEPDFFKRQARRAPRCAHHRAALRALGPPADTPPFSPARSAPSPAPRPSGAHLGGLLNGLALLELLHGRAQRAVAAPHAALRQLVPLPVPLPKVQGGLRAARRAARAAARPPPRGADRARPHLDAQPCARAQRLRAPRHARLLPKRTLTARRMPRPPARPPLARADRLEARAAAQGDPRGRVSRSGSRVARDEMGEWDAKRGASWGRRRSGARARAPLILRYGMG